MLAIRWDGVPPIRVVQEEEEDGQDKNAMVTMMAQQIRLLHEQMKLIASTDAKDSKTKGKKGHPGDKTKKNKKSSKTR